MEITVEQAIANLQEELKAELLSDIVPYWLNNTVDHKNGGFIGRITYDNEPVFDAGKGAILTARVLWTFSSIYRRIQKEEYRTMADHAYKYLTSKLWDEEYGGVYWMVTANGEPKDTRKHVYVQAFAIYALSEYYLAFHKEEALEQAKELYHLIEDKCTDSENGGYYESYTYAWQLMDDVRLSDKDINEPKSMNTHLHVLEAYTNLYRCWPDELVAERLSQLIDIFAGHIVNPERSSMHTFLGEDWEPRSDEISFGHDIEASWLLIEAAEVLGNYPRREEVKSISLSLAKAVMKDGLDQNGGLLNEADSSGITDDNKDWWPQAEAIVGFYNAWQLTGDPEFLAASCSVWDFIQKYVLDKKYGEWHEKVTRMGVPHKLDKVRSWKCPYHNSRAVLEILARSENSQNILSPSKLGELIQVNTTSKKEKS
ncbi:AGE family epimerase/isomerase [Gracilimonas mengyeensis]|uniref:Cellobiose 2-epimerase n=1 Tax=Gracilimonas mengyeensis TaxID=1302730 RepID=A0A521AHG8_9BACT|nr:AGE family epimerase/isomerase [Gracilimonas mengyeensis]SMO34223.1 mannobiose 2-epimerase [Gracilimonas mengyeensis]